MCVSLWKGFLAAVAPKTIIGALSETENFGGLVSPVTRPDESGISIRADVHLGASEEGALLQAWAP